MIAAHERLLVAALGGREARAAVAADVQEGAELAVARPRDDQRHAERVVGQEISRRRDLRRVGDEIGVARNSVRRSASNRSAER